MVTAATETIDSRHLGLDSWPSQAILAAFSDGQERALRAVRSAHETIANAAETMVRRLGDAGRIVYTGAGSSGLIAALDGMELGGTFGWPDDRLAFVLANGETVAPLTGHGEDDTKRARDAIATLRLTRDDVVIAVAASGTTPFTLAAVDEAAGTGALTIGIANNPDSPLLRQVDIPVFLDSGPEVIVGSTRMGAGTAQKAALAMISSLAMIRLGHIYDGLMVNLRADNLKLKRRAVAALVHITGRTANEAEGALELCEGSIKAAALVLRGLGRAEAERALAEAHGNLRTALARLDRNGAELSMPSG